MRTPLVAIREQLRYGDRRVRRTRRGGLALGVRDDSESAETPAGSTIAPGALTAIIARLARAPTQQAPLLPGARVGRYEIIREIGRGGFGCVYEAHDTALHRLVALKVLYGARATGSEAATEGEAAARLAHPNIAALHDAGLLECGTPYLVYEMLHGETLESRLARGPLPPREALAIGAQVARALAHAHAQSVVHRDLKPANVFLTADGEVKVLDFGVALLFGREAPAAGTPAYMAPEQRRGEPEDARTDLYALGVLLREALIGSATAAPGSSVPPPLRGILASLLAEDPTARPRGARAALTALESAARAFATPRMRLRRTAMALGALLLMAGAVSGGLLYRERQERRAAVGERGPSVAVLPFTDLSPGRDQEYFSDGLAEEILNALAQVEGLRVAGRTSSFALRGRRDDLHAIGRTLSVGTVLEGSVRKSGTRLRITARLVSVADGYDLWSRTFDRELRDVFVVQDEIATAVAQALQVKLLRPNPPTTRAQRTDSAEAHLQYLIGRQLYVRNSMDAYQHAVDAFQKALALDPGYAPAHAWLALALRDLADHAVRPEAATELRRRALDEAERAVVLGPDLADAFAARALLRINWTHDWSGAKADLARALTLNPNDPAQQRRQGLLFASLGRLEEAVAAVKKATELDPLNPVTWNWLGWLQMSQGRFELGKDATRRAIAISPEAEDAHINLAYCAILEGRPAEALADVPRLREMEGLEVKAMAEHDLGHAVDEQRALDTLTSKYGHVDAAGVAYVYAWRRDRDHAFAWLERALGQELSDLKFNPFLRDLRGDPRYGALLRRMNLPPD